MKRIISIILGLLVLLPLFVTSCSSDDNNVDYETIKVSIDNGVIEITDSLGRVITLDETPQRLVSLSPGNTEILYALGLEDNIVGVTSYCNYPVVDGKKPSESKPQVGGFSTVDIEKVVAQEPDLVLAARKHQDNGTIDELEKHGIKVIALLPSTVEEVMHALSGIGKITGTESEAKALVKDMQTRLDAVNALVEDLSDEEKPRVFYVVWNDPPQSIGNDILQSYVMEKAGGTNIFDDQTQYPTVSLEEIIERDPQFIIVNVSHGSSDQKVMDWAETDDQLKDTSARKNGNVLSIDADIMNRPGPRIIDAAEEMLGILHPSLAEELSSRNSIRSTSFGTRDF